MSAVILAGLRDDSQWETYIREADPAAALFERARRIYEFQKHCKAEHGKQGGSYFAEFMEARMGYSASTATMWATIGKSAPQLFDNVKKFAIDFRAIYDFTRLPEEQQFALLEAPGIIDRKAVDNTKRAAKISEGDAKAEGKSSPDASISEDQEVIACDALITDPPYGILDEEWEPEHLEQFTREWAERWSECGAHTILIFWSQRYLREGLVWLEESFSEYEYTQLLVWHYPNNKKPQSRRMFKQTWEPILYFRRRDSEHQIGANYGEWGDGLNDFDCHVAATPQSNFNDDNCKRHPAQKPVSVMRWLVGASTAPGELICDPFAGSGTTGIAAAQLGRRFHGIETNEDYAALAVKRIASYGVR